MKVILFCSLLLITLHRADSQVLQVTIGNTQGSFDSSFVIQTSQTDSFHTGNHPGAGPYMNAEIYLCGGANLVYNYQPGTSSEPYFYLESGSTLNFTQWTVAKIYAKSGSTINLNNAIGYFSIHREAGVNILNISSSSAIWSDSVYTTINYAFPSWPGGNSPCLSPTGIAAIQVEDNLQISNPVQEIVHVLCKGNYTAMRLELYDLTGRKVFHTQLDEGHQTRSVNVLPKGLYVYRFLSDQGLLKQDKLLIQ